MTPDQINHLIKTGRLRMRPVGGPGPGMPPGMPPAVGAAMPMDPTQYRAELCMQEINEVCKKYRCRLVPRIIIDKMAGIDGIVAIVPVNEEGKPEGLDAIDVKSNEAPAAPPAPPIDPATLSNDEVERLARENLERERAKLRSEREGSETPNQEA